MPELQAFRGLRYDPAAVTDLGAVLCPPYDVISAAERDALAALEARNAVALELPAAPAGGDPYAVAARTLAAWLDDGTLRQDDEPLAYIYEQRYSVGDVGERVARSFFCRLRLEDYGPGSGVRPHELTLAAPKEDRFRLLAATRVNLSPVLLLYDDGAAGAASAGLLDALTGAPPAAAAAGPGGVGQRLWAANPDETAEARALLELASRSPLTIADGHHRYETALRYRDTPGAVRGADFVLALLYDAHSGGLALRPWHRVVAGPIDSGELLAVAAGSFQVEPLGSPDELLDRMRLDDAAAPAGTLGLWTRRSGAILSVNRPDSQVLDVDVLSSTLPQMIGSTTAELNAAGRLSYVSDARDAIGAVESGLADLCFLVRPTPVRSVLSVAAAGGYMPPKSTFFHPKAATGLVFNPLWS